MNEETGGNSAGTGGNGGGLSTGVGSTNGVAAVDEYDDDDNEPCSKKIMPALFAWFLLISASSSYFTLVLPEFINLLGHDRLYLFVLIVIMHAIIFLYVILNFSIATFMDPGRFPKVDLSDVLEEDGIHHSGTYKNVLINDINVRMKWCTTCQFYRPPRSSHCGVCNSCIDTMDHHCPWVCNCIARRNYKYFFLFLISLTFHMIIIFGLCLTLVLFNKENLTHLPIIISMLLIVLVGILIIPIGGLTGFHIILVTRGRTTNEQVTGKFRTGVNPFDKGCWQNWKQILCTSTVPSYMKFRRKKIKQKQYLETRMLVKFPYSKTNNQNLNVYNNNNTTNNNKIITTNKNAYIETKYKPTTNENANIKIKYNKKNGFNNNNNNNNNGFESMPIVDQIPANVELIVQDPRCINASRQAKIITQTNKTNQLINEQQQQQQQIIINENEINNNPLISSNNQNKRTRKSNKKSQQQQQQQARNQEYADAQQITASNRYTNNKHQKHNQEELQCFQTYHSSSNNNNNNNQNEIDEYDNTPNLIYQQPFVNNVNYTNNTNNIKLNGNSVNHKSQNGNLNGKHTKHHNHHQQQHQHHHHHQQQQQPLPIEPQEQVYNQQEEQNVWIDRKSNKLINNNYLDEQQQQQQQQLQQQQQNGIKLTSKKKYNNHYENSVGMTKKPVQIEQAVCMIQSQPITTNNNNIKQAQQFINVQNIKTSSNQNLRNGDKNSINKLMNAESKRQLIINSNGDSIGGVSISVGGGGGGGSSNGSSRYIRNNSYLNANHTTNLYPNNVNIIPNNSTNHLNYYAGVNGGGGGSSSGAGSGIGLSNIEIRPSSSTSTSSSLINSNGGGGGGGASILTTSSNINFIKIPNNSKKKIKSNAYNSKDMLNQIQIEQHHHQHHHQQQQQQQLNVIEEKPSTRILRANNQMNSSQDYASYEITV